MILSNHQSWVLVLLLHSALGLNDHHLASCKTPIQARGWASCRLNHLFNGLISASDHGDCHIIDMFSKLTIAQGQGQYLNSGFSGFFCSLYYSSMPCNLGLLYFLFFKFYFIFTLYIIVLVLPNIKMNLSQVYLWSPSWTLLPPPSPYHPSGSSQCTSPKHPVSCIEPGLASRFIRDILHVSYMPIKYFIFIWKK